MPDSFTQEVADDAFLQNVKADMAAAQRNGDIAGSVEMLMRLKRLSGGTLPRPLQHQLDNQSGWVEQQRMLADAVRAPLGARE